MPITGLLSRSRSFRSRRAEGGLYGALGLASYCDARDEDIPYDWRRTASPPISGTTATIDQLTLPDTLSRPSRSQQSSTGSHFLSAPGSPVSYGSLDREMIGLALGSPHESPLPPLPPEDRLENHLASCKSSEPIPTTQSGSYASKIGVDSEKPRMVKWRSLGGLFGKRSAVSPSAPLYQVLPSSGEEAPEQRRFQRHTLGRVRSDEDQLTRAQRPLVLPSQQRQASQSTSSASHVHNNEPSAQSQRRVRTRRTNVKLAASPTRPKQPRSQTCAMAEHQGKCPVPPPKDVDVKPGIATMQFDGGSLLQVEIPSVQLERYSVMFQNLLQAPPLSSSLLARRHGHLEEMRSIIDIGKQATASVDAQPLPAPSRPHSTSPARSPSLSLFPPTFLTDSRRISQEERPAPSSLHRSLTSPNLTSSQRSNSLKSPPTCNTAGSSHGPLVIEYLTDKLALPHGPKGDLDLLTHSRSSTEISFHTAAESQSTEAISNPAKNQQGLPPRTSSIRSGQPLRSSKSEILPAVYPTVATSAHNVQGRVFELQDGKEKRVASVVVGRAPAPTPLIYLEDPSPEIKPAPPLRVLKNGYVCNTLPSAPALVPATELPKQIGKGAAPLLQDGKGHRSRSAPIISPLASHPTKRQMRATDAPAIPFPDMPTSAPPNPPTDSKPSMNPTQPIRPKPTVFSPPPPPSSTISPSPSAPAPLPPAAQELPEKPKSAAEISIARQISISRRQRELLAPLAPKYARQPMQPMLVDVRGGTPMARKSSHLILEDA